MSDCIFCRIASDEAPCFKLAENELALAFLDIHPAAEGHCLVIPKEHFENIFDIRAADFAAVSELARRLAPALRAVVQPAGMVVTQANGAVAGQSVMHLHTHLIPRNKGKRLKMHGDEIADPASLRQLAIAISAHIVS